MPVNVTDPSGPVTWSFGPEASVTAGRSPTSRRTEALAPATGVAPCVTVTLTDRGRTTRMVTPVVAVAPLLSVATTSRSWTEPFGSAAFGTASARAPAAPVIGMAVIAPVARLRSVAVRLAMVTPPPVAVASTVNSGGASCEMSRVPSTPLPARLSVTDGTPGWSTNVPRMVVTLPAASARVTRRSYACFAGVPVGSGSGDAQSPATMPTVPPLARRPASVVSTLRTTW